MGESTDFLKTLDLSRVTTYQGGIMLAATHRLISKEVSLCLKKYNLTMMEWFAVGFIYDHKQTRTSELSKNLNFTMPYATNLVKGLEAKGYVARVDDTIDSRSKFLELTQIALEEYATIEKDLRGVLRQEVYRKVLPEDFLIYMKVLFELGAYSPEIA